MPELKDLTLPGYVIVGDRPIGPYPPGVQVWLNASRDFASGRWVLVERVDGHELMKCEARADGKWLIAYTGDEVSYTQPPMVTSCRREVVSRTIFCCAR